VINLYYLIKYLELCKKIDGNHGFFPAESRQEWALHILKVKGDRPGDDPESTS
jgi:hypothetical protein